MGHRVNGEMDPPDGGEVARGEKAGEDDMLRLAPPDPLFQFDDQVTK
jgi:hypothetical protein